MCVKFLEKMKNEALCGMRETKCNNHFIMNVYLHGQAALRPEEQPLVPRASLRVLESR
jgi:hypothetical protein